MHEDKLILRMEQGDARAADELIRIYYPEILRYCLWHAPNRSLAEDAAQETFLKAVRYFNRYTHKGKFRSFLYQIASNTCIDMGRKKWSTEIGLEDLQTEPVYLDKAFEDIHMELDLKRLMSNLSREQQEVIVLRFVQELSVREISEVLRVPMRTIQSRLRLALKYLKKEMEKGGSHIG